MRDRAVSQREGKRVRGAAAERELAWERGGGASRALRPRELGQAVFWAGLGERKWAAGK